MKQRILTMTTVSAMLAALALAGCDRGDQSSAGNGADRSAAQGDQGARSGYGDDVKSGIDRAKSATENTASRMGEKIDDAVITTTVKTELAKDAQLRATNINVDTDHGRVALKGKAPSNEAREHATTLAQNVKGVASVDNQLTVEPG